MKILCLYHTDLDGAGSAAIVGLYHSNDKIKFKMYNYGWPLSPGDFKGYQKIYAVDISFHQDNPWVYDIENLIWIDHHKTALDYESKNPKLQNIPGLRAIGKGACELTWEYFYPGFECPELIKYFSTYDVWDKTRLDWKTVEEVELGAKFVLGVRPVEILRFLVENRSPQELQIKGQTILEYIEKSGKGKLLGGGFYIPNFNGYRVMSLNTSDFSSLSFHSLYDPKVIDVMMPFQIVPVEDKPGEMYVRVSFYTENPNIDVSVIAKQYGGGGHRGASGCQISIETLSMILSSGYSLKSFINNETQKP